MELNSLTEQTNLHYNKILKILDETKKLSLNLNSSKSDKKNLENLTANFSDLSASINEFKNKSDQLADLVKITFKEKSAQEKRTKYYKLLYEKGIEVSGEYDVTKLLNTALDAVIEISNAERGFITVMGENNSFDIIAARAIEDEEIKNPESNVSKTVLQEVFKLGENISSGRIQDDSRFKNHSSIVRLNITSVICIPLQISSKTFGALYLDNKNSQDAFDIKSLSILQSFADQICRAVDAALRVENLKKEHNALIHAAASRIKFRQIIGNSKVMDKALLQVLQVAPTDATVLLLGESGTGKELIARAIHENSNRINDEFIALNCSAIPNNLLESELFGHEKGAFTGASTKKIGKFEAADGGTLFLDEIADMAPELQVKLLRILQTMEFQPLGSNVTKKVDVRIIAATNQPLKEKVNKGFREDLYYRLNVFSITLPPLRNRKEDIPSLVYHFFEKYKSRHNKPFIEKISPEIFVILTDYNWPGNVRELENVIERAVILCQEKILTHKDMPQELTQSHSDFTEQINETENDFEGMVNNYKRNLILRILGEKNNNITEVAKALKINRSYLYRLMSKLGISEN